MFGTKPLASLSSGLLARKGQAKPAMRPQGFHGYHPGPHNDDLGWNDMGHDAPPPAPVAQPVPMDQPAPVAPARPDLAPPAELPPVLRQREELAEEMAAPEPVPPAPAPVPTVAPARRGISVATAQRIGRETRRRKGKAAFTLRLDAERHLKLRLASAVEHRSAQMLVVEALDRLLDEKPEVAALLGQLASSKNA